MSRPDMVRHVDDVGSWVKAPVGIFSDRSHFSQADRCRLSELLRPFWKDREFADVERQRMYGCSAADFKMVEDLSQADIAVLPMTWNYYVSRRMVSVAHGFIQAARQAGVAVLSYVSGDEGVTVPESFEDVYVVRASGSRRRKRARQIAQPVFFDDPLKEFPDLDCRRDGDLNDERGVEEEPGASTGRGTEGDLPSVGFCGQANAKPLKLCWDALRQGWRNGLYQAGLRSEEPQPLFPPALWRVRAMTLLSRSPRLRTCFKPRSQYRAGAGNAASRLNTSREFYENIAQTDYTLCVRGGGNFSKRFYETLAMGRIPVLLDTDCLLPFEGVLPWDELIVRVPSGDLRSLPERLRNHFDRAKNRNELEEIKRKCRRMWEEWLSFGGFHRNLLRLVLNRP